MRLKLRPGATVFGRKLVGISPNASAVGNFVFSDGASVGPPVKVGYAPFAYLRSGGGGVSACPASRGPASSGACALASEDELGFEFPASRRAGGAASVDELVSSGGALPASSPDRPLAPAV